MKIRKIIEMLLQYDLDDELVVQTEDGNVDILGLEMKPGSYDGPYQVLDRDWDMKCYNVTGATLRNDGQKLVLIPHSILDALIDEPDMPIKVAGRDKKQLQKRVDRMKKEIEDTLNKIRERRSSND